VFLAKNAKNAKVQRVPVTSKDNLDTKIIVLGSGGVEEWGSTGVEE
jgi:hypothetical protein